MNTKRSRYKVRAYPLDIKTTAQDGSFEGYGSVFGTVDSYNEIVAPGAFTRSLAQIAAKNRRVPVLWQHRAGEPIGVYSTLSEDSHGLLVKGTLLVDAVARAAEAHALAQAGAVTGLSIGYVVRDSVTDQKSGVLTLTELDLLEVSLVTFPANDDARLETIKSKLAHGEVPTLPEFERFLREAGFSKTQAAVIANRGLSHLIAGVEAGEEAQFGDALKAARAFSLPTF